MPRVARSLVCGNIGTGSDPDDANAGSPCDKPTSLIYMVGARRFELPTPCTPCRCATRLRYAPTQTRDYSGITQPVLEAAVFAPVPDVFRPLKHLWEQEFPGTWRRERCHWEAAESEAHRARYRAGAVRH